jgi:hypothetical protein
MGMDVIIGGLAAMQHGVFTREQASDAGASDAVIKKRRSSGRWIRLRQGVYAIAGAPPTWEQRVMAMVLAAGEGAVASHLTGAALHRFPDVRPGTLEVSVPPTRQARVHGIAVHRPGRLDPLDVSEVDGIPATSFARTLVDCSARLSLGQVARALDAGLIAHQVSLVAVERVLEGLPAGPNRRPSVIRTLLSERGAETEHGESRPEMRVHRVLIAAGLPAPTQQHRVDVDGHRFRVDLAYPERRLAIEYDGWAFHRSRTAFDADRRRDRLLQRSGWTVLRFTSTSSDHEIATTVAEFVRFRSA